MITILNNVFAKLRFLNFDIKDIYAYSILFENKNTVNYNKSGRTKNLLHFVTGGERIYEIDDRIFKCSKNTLIFIPEGTKYKTVANTVNGEKCCGIGITFNFDINPNIKEDIYFIENIKHKESILNFFERTYNIHINSPLEPLHLKTSVYSLLSFLVSSNFTTAEYSVIKPAIEYINSNYTENLSVKTYAQKCNLSESYFRKKFLEYTGLSPIEYRNQLRFAEAKRLYQNGHSTQQFCEKLGFCDTGYMLKLYRRKNGSNLKNDAKII